MESRLGGEGRKGGLCSLCNREWPGVCCSSGNVARCQKVGGWKRVRVGGDDMEEGGGGRGWLARVTLKNDAGEREWICILEQQQFFQINFLVSSLKFSFARCGDGNIEFFLVFSDFDRSVE